MIIDLGVKFLSMEKKIGGCIWLGIRMSLNAAIKERSGIRCSLQVLTMDHFVITIINY